MQALVIAHMMALMTTHIAAFTWQMPCSTCSSTYDITYDGSHDSTHGSTCGQPSYTMTGGLTVCAAAFDCILEIWFNGDHEARHQSVSAVQDEAQRGDFSRDASTSL